MGIPLLAVKMSLSLQPLGNHTLSVSKGKKVWVEEKWSLSSSSPMRGDFRKLPCFNPEPCRLPFKGCVGNSSLPAKDGMSTVQALH